MQGGIGERDLPLRHRFQTQLILAGEHGEVLLRGGQGRGCGDEAREIAEIGKEQAFLRANLAEQAGGAAGAGETGLGGLLSLEHWPGDDDLDAARTRRAEQGAEGGLDIGERGIVKAIFKAKREQQQVGAALGAFALQRGDRLRHAGGDDGLEDDLWAENRPLLGLQTGIRADEAHAAGEIELRGEFFGELGGETLQQRVHGRVRALQRGIADDEEVQAIAAGELQQRAGQMFLQTIAAGIAELKIGLRGEIGRGQFFLRVSGGGLELDDGGLSGRIGRVRRVLSEHGSGAERENQTVTEERHAGRMWRGGRAFPAERKEQRVVTY